MFKKLSIAEQADVLKAASILEEHYNPEYVKTALQVMGEQLDYMGEEGAGKADQIAMDFEVIQGPEQKENVETYEHMEIGGNHAEEYLYEIGSEKPEKVIDRPFTKERAEQIAKDYYRMSLNELLVTKYYKEHMNQRQIAENVFDGLTKQRTISSWLTDIPKSQMQLILSNGAGHE